MVNSREDHGKKTGIYTRYQKKKRTPWIFLILLVLIIVSIFVMNRPGSKISRARQGGQETSRIQSRGEFTKEGELSFLKSDNSLIVKIDIEIADDDLQREKGLMYRKQMDMLTGMLFIFEDEDYRSFWMKNTYLPLDIIYLDAGKRIVRIHENTPPQSLRSIPSDHPAKYVVEVIAGFTALYGIKVGDMMVFER
ncbi:MAG: DUF192 domain-containing protein [Bacteroidota bacterium]